MKQSRLTTLFAVAGFCALALGVVATALAGPPEPSVQYSVAYIEARLRAPIRVVDEEQARPSIEGDRSARVALAGPAGEAPMSAKWKPVAPPGEGFNNEPRYELAAYLLQKLFLEECEYVVPATVLRALPLEEYRRLRGTGVPTLRGTRSAFFLLSYWLANVSPNETWDPGRFERDPLYARHWGNLNILTHIIDHKDSNYQNLLISRNPQDPRVFAVDNDVAFESRVSDLGDEWRRLQVDRLPARTIERLRRLTPEDLQGALAVVAEFRVEDGVLVEVHPPGDAIQPRRGVRSGRGTVQFGLTSFEIQQVMRRITALLAEIDAGRLELVPDSHENIGAACREAVAR